MIKITQLSQLDLNQTYSYADYLTWQFSEALELIKGKIMLMSPAPNVEHQRIERKLLVAIDWYFKGKKCEVFPAPFDVRLYDRKKSLLTSKDIHTVVQPDLCVICNPGILDKQAVTAHPTGLLKSCLKAIPNGTCRLNTGSTRKAECRNIGWSIRTTRDSSICAG